MVIQTKLSAKGQVVIPKDVRDRLGLRPGDALTIEMTLNGLRLRKARTRQAVPLAEGLRQLGRLRLYKGPPVSDDEMRGAVRTRAARPFR